MFGELANDVLSFVSFIVMGPERVPPHGKTHSIGYPCFDGNLHDFILEKILSPKKTDVGL